MSVARRRELVAPDHALPVVRQCELLSISRSVRRMRPDYSWGDVVRVLNRAGAKWTTDKLRLTVRRLTEERIIEQGLLDRAPRRSASERQMRLVYAIATAAPEKTLEQIAAQLEAMRERTPRGGTRWHASGVKALLDRARS